jgi:hypothetical protein
MDKQLVVCAYGTEIAGKKLFIIIFMTLLRFNVVV